MQRSLNRIAPPAFNGSRSEEHTSELQSQSNLVCRLLLEKKKSACPSSTPVTTASSTGFLPSLYAFVSHDPSAPRPWQGRSASSPLLHSPLLEHHRVGQSF